MNSVSYREYTWTESTKSLSFEDKTKDGCTVVDGTGSTDWTDGGWYVVQGENVGINSRITVTGKVNLILADGAKLTASQGITTTGATLNIYGQSRGTGTLVANGDNNTAGIGGNSAVGIGSGWDSANDQGTLKVGSSLTVYGSRSSNPPLWTETLQKDAEGYVSENSRNYIRYMKIQIAVTGVKLNSKEVSLAVGKTETLTATVSPEDAADKSVTWSSSRAEVASVDQTGKVTGLAVGEATITVTTIDGGFTAECKVTVEEAPLLMDMEGDTFEAAEGTAMQNIRIAALAGSNLQWSVTGQPAWMTVTSTDKTLTLSGTPTQGEAGKTYPITVTAKNDVDKADTTVTVSVKSSSGGSSGNVWTVNLSEYVAKQAEVKTSGVSVADASKVVSVKSYDDAGKEMTGEYDPLTGTASFKSRPNDVTYWYNTEHNDVLMDVTLVGAGIDPVTASHSSSNCGNGCNSGFTATAALLALALLTRRRR